MKSKILIVVCLFFIGCKGISQDRQYIYSEIEKDLSIIKNFVDGKDIDASLRRAEAVAFMEKLSKIESESPFTAEAKLDPTKPDYDKWNKWYVENKNKLYWDKRKKKISVRNKSQ